MFEKDASLKLYVYGKKRAARGKKMLLSVQKNKIPHDL